MKQQIGVVYVAAGLLELLGLWCTFRDLLAVQRRLRDYVGRPINIFANDVVAVSDMAAVGVVTGPPPTLEQRVDALELWRESVPDQLASRDETLRTHLRSELASEVSAVRNSMNDRLVGLQEVVGKPEPFWWRGPLMLVLGVLLGTLGNLLALSAGG